MTPFASGRTTPTLERPYPFPRQPVPKTRARPRLCSAVAGGVEDTSACQTVRPSLRSRDPIQALFDVRLEPWEVYDPEENSHKDQLHELRTFLATENQRVRQRAEAAEQRARKLDALAREKARPLRDPFALLDRSSAIPADCDIEGPHDSQAQSTNTDCEYEEDARVSSAHIFIPLRRFSND